MLAEEIPISNSPPEMPPEVAKVFDGFPAAARRVLTEVRNLIFETAKETAGVGRLTETLKWSEPAYLTTRTKSGSTIRLGWKLAQPGECKVYFICTTGLVDEFRGLFPDDLVFEGNRAIRLDLSKKIPAGPLRACIRMALTYHLNKEPRG